jgi:hypothetical protein
MLPHRKKLCEKVSCITRSTPAFPAPKVFFPHRLKNGTVKNTRACVQGSKIACGKKGCSAGALSDRTLIASKRDRINAGLRARSLTCVVAFRAQNLCALCQVKDIAFIRADLSLQQMLPLSVA